MLELEKNEIQDVWIEITERDAGNVTLTTYTFEVFDDADSSVQTSATASISGNGTATVKLYGLVDTTAAAFTAGESFYVRFTYAIGSETYIEDAWFVVT